MVGEPDESTDKARWTRKTRLLIQVNAMSNKIIVYSELTWISNVFFVIWAINILPVPASARWSAYRLFEHVGRLRREGDRRPNTTSTLLLRQVECVITSAWSTAERVLLHVAEATVTELLLLSGLGAESSITNQHTEALFCLAVSLVWMSLFLTLGKAVTLVFPS